MIGSHQNYICACGNRLFYYTFFLIYFSIFINSFCRIRFFHYSKISLFKIKSIVTSMSLHSQHLSPIFTYMYPTFFYRNTILSRIYNDLLWFVTIRHRSIVNKILTIFIYDRSVFYRNIIFFWPVCRVLSLLYTNT